MLSIQHLNIGYQNHNRIQQILKDVHLDLPEATNLVLFGKSGDGKSTLGKFLVNILPTNADIGDQVIYQLDGIDISKLEDKEKRKILANLVGYVHQNPMMTLNPTKRIRWHLNRLNQLHGLHLPESSFVQHLEKLGFRQPQVILNSFPHQISIGQSQRIVWLLATIHQPKLIIADEPFSGQDQARKEFMLSTLREANSEKGMSSIIITHDQSIADSGFSNIYHIKNHQLYKFDQEIDIDIPEYSGSHQENGNELLTLEHLQVFYREGLLWHKRKTIIEETSARIFERDAIGIIGESGSGKSTLARSIGGILTSYLGTIYWKGRDIHTISDKDYFKQVQYIMQEPRLAIPARKMVYHLFDDVLTSFFPKIPREEKISRMHNILSEMKLESHFLEKFPESCSGGEVQRITLAKALLVHPKLLIFDETFSSLDWPTRNSILRLLREIKIKHGLTYLFISHQTDFLRQICNKIWKIDNGRVYEEAIV